jgi:hypothetical protein
MSCELWIFNITFIVVKDDRSGPKGQGDVAQGFGVSENGEYRRKCHISIGKLMVNHRNLRFSQHFLAPKPYQLQVSCGALPEVAFGLLLLGTLNYNFVELIAATVIFDCVWSPGAFRVSTWLL